MPRTLTSSFPPCFMSADFLIQFKWAYLHHLCVMALVFCYHCYWLTCLSPWRRALTGGYLSVCVGENARMWMCGRTSIYYVMDKMWRSDNCTIYHHNERWQRFDIEEVGDLRQVWPTVLKSTEQMEWPKQSIPRPKNKYFWVLETGGTGGV